MANPSSLAASTANSSFSSGSECGICYESMAGKSIAGHVVNIPGNTPEKVANMVGHFFCTDCLNAYQRINPGATCPLCREFTINSSVRIPPSLVPQQSSSSAQAMDLVDPVVAHALARRLNKAVRTRDIFLLQTILEDDRDRHFQLSNEMLYKFLADLVRGINLDPYTAQDRLYVNRHCTNEMIIMLLDHCALKGNPCLTDNQLLELLSGAINRKNNIVINKLSEHLSDERSIVTAMSYFIDNYLSLINEVSPGECLLNEYKQMLTILINRLPQFVEHPENLSMFINRSLLFINERWRNGFLRMSVKHSLSAMLKPLLEREDRMLIQSHLMHKAILFIAKYGDDSMMLGLLAKCPRSLEQYERSTAVEEALSVENRSIVEMLLQEGIVNEVTRARALEFLNPSQNSPSCSIL